MKQKDRPLRARLLQEPPVQAQAVVRRQKNILGILHEPNARENFLRLFGTAPLGNDFRLREIRDRPAATGDQK